MTSIRGPSKPLRSQTRPAASCAPVVRGAKDSIMGADLTQRMFDVFARVERLAARAQGKGHGTATVEKEARIAYSFAGKATKLALDIGGNAGDYTAALRRHSDCLEIHTFEPSATNIAKLAERFRADHLVNVVPMAVSRANGIATLFSNHPGSGLGSLTKRRLTHFNIRFDVQEPVRTVRLEDYWHTHLGRRTLDLVKLDIEGHELDAIEGFGDALRFTRVLQFEFGGCNIDTRTYFQDFWYFLSANRFSIFRITPFGPQAITRYQERDEYFSTTNYIAVNRCPA